MNKKIVILSAMLFVSNVVPFLQERADAQETVVRNQWNGKKVAYLGDSITDKNHIGTTKNYWQYLEELLGMRPIVMGISGHQWNQILGQAEKLKQEQGDDVDAILIFAGTNDYYGNVPLGEWYNIQEEDVEISGKKMTKRMRRSFTDNEGTLRGRINRAMSYLKKNYPTKQIIILTPIHRGYATFGDNNIQPDESYPNALGLYIDDYVDAIKEAANVWAVPVIDLNSICGILPNEDSHTLYISKEKTDRLHPNAAGHERMAKALMYQLLSYPASF